MKYITAKACVEKLTNTKTKKMMDLGCGIGIIGEYVKKLDPEINITGIDLDDKRLEQAKSKNVYEKLMFCDVTSDEIDFSKFDLILTADVLEHLAYPDLFLTSLKKKIKDDVQFVIFIPNVSHFHIILKLIIGNFEYEKEGIMDDTHLRFYTKKSFINFLNKLGFEIELVKASVVGSQYKYLVKIFPFLEHLFSAGYLFSARFKN